jgi:hypothetical protein
MLTMIYMTRILNMSFSLLKGNFPSVRHPVRPLSGPRVAPRVAPCLAPIWHPVGPPSGPRWAPRSAPIGSKKINFLFLFLCFGCCCRLEKRGKKFSVFSFQSPRSLSSPSSPSFVGKAARRRFFRPSSPSHPSKLYSSLGWLNSKVPKPFFPFTLRLIDVDGF